MNSYDVGDWVRYKGSRCRVLGHWHDKQWVDHLVLGVPAGITISDGQRHVSGWSAAGKAEPSAVELIKRRPKNHDEVTEG